MSSLSVYHISSPGLPNKVLTHLEDIASTLAEHGVGFDRWQASAPISPGASQEEVIAAYQVQIDKLMTERGTSLWTSSALTVTIRKKPNCGLNFSTSISMAKTRCASSLPDEGCSRCTSTTTCMPCCARKMT